MSATQAISPKTYATKKNERFANKNSKFVSVAERWRSSLASLPSANQRAISIALAGAVAEFKRRHPTLKSWNDLALTEAKEAMLGDIAIDVTMQRPLNIDWVLELFSKFSEDTVMAVQVYRDQSTPSLVAWDGQHTAVLLWLIATQVFGSDTSKCMVPVNISKSKDRARMRQVFIRLNGMEGKKALDELDRFEQTVFAVRVDGNVDPRWQVVESKQKILEKYDLFVTHSKYGDESEPNAISRMPEITRMVPQSLEWLCSYLSIATKGQRAVAEKEILMMSHFFERCRVDDVPVDDTYITELYLLFDRLFNCDFSPNGAFWAKAGMAYKAWHAKQPVNALNNTGMKFSKEVYHGEPFMIAQLEKSFSKPLPTISSNTPFWPDAADLW